MGAATAAQRTVPIAVRLDPGLTPHRVFERLRQLPHCLFLDSAQQAGGVGRYSYLAADPFLMVTSQRPCPRWWRELEAMSMPWRGPRIEGLPPFQGGLVGVLSYEFGQAWEAVPEAKTDEFRLPPCVAAWYDVVVAFDHERHESWIISQGLPETEERARRERAGDRLHWMQEVLQGTDLPSDALRRGAVTYGDTRLREDELAAPFPWEGSAIWRSNFERRGYERAVRAAIDYIEAGDVFQVNLSQRLVAKQELPSDRLFQRLRRINPAPFAAYFDAGDYQIVSASPERFLSVRDRVVETRPIKGTRHRLRRQPADLYSADLLASSSKDLAENTMIVDLLRNDLSRVCEDDSIRVEKLCGVEAFEYVQHLVSVGSGRLREDRSPFDLLPAAFPGGSITGAPKIRAIEIIAELEPTVRGPYCGTLFYIGFDGTMDSSILIRTITASRGWLQLPVGGGVVAASDPSAEYIETCHKARGMVDVLG